ncbi:hypothetical protein JW933_01820 [candidate division FCPU426 bacterium]|nr:hypothetical protein [candidate division FCPU426 bacterium]
MSIQRLLLTGGLLFILAGCRASYPTGSVDKTIRELCEKEYGVDVVVKTNNRTIGALVVMEDTLLPDLTFSDQALKKIEDVMLTTSRVTLSSEFPYDFFVIAIRDSKSTVQVSFVRYIKDIRRLIMDDISRNDYFQRLLIDVESEGPPETGSGTNFALRDWKVSDFLARQIAERLRTQLQINLVIERLFSIRGLEGRFDYTDKARQEGQFVLTLFFDPRAPSFQTTGTEALRENFLKVLFETAKKMVRRYEFSQYTGLSIEDESGRVLAKYDRAAFSKGSMNTLMELIRSIKEKRE